MTITYQTDAERAQTEVIRAVRAGRDILAHRVEELEAENARLRAGQGTPVAWEVYVPEAQHGYLVDGLDDAQLVDDMTNCDGVTATPLYAAPPAQPEPAQRVEELEAENTRLRAGMAEPVMTIGINESEKCRSLPFGMNLYAAPPAQPADAKMDYWRDLAKDALRRLDAREAENARLRSGQGEVAGYFVKEHNSLWSQVGKEYEKDDDVIPLYAAFKENQT
jgi:hypothetical protein